MSSTPPSFTCESSLFLGFSVSLGISILVLTIVEIVFDVVWFFDWVIYFWCVGSEDEFVVVDILFLVGILVVVEKLAMMFAVAVLVVVYEIVVVTEIVAKVEIVMVV